MYTISQRIYTFNHMIYILVAPSRIMAVKGTIIPVKQKAEKKIQRDWGLLQWRLGLVNFSFRQYFKSSFMSFGIVFQQDIK